METLSAIPLLVQVLRCLGAFLLYIAPCVAVLLFLYLRCSVPKFIFRKVLHLVAFSCVTLMILAAESWQAAALTAVLIAVAVYPILALLEPRPWFAGLFVQKSPGEVKRSLLMLFLMFAALTAVAWGLCGKPAVGAAAILMWGNGDAAAALVGIPLGKHKVKARLTDGKKSWEGSGAMLATSFLCGLLVLWLYAELPLGRALLCAAAAGLLGTATELFSPSEWDTVTVPAVMLAVLLLLT